MIVRPSLIARRSNSLCAFLLSFSGEKATGISVKLRPNIAISGELVLFEAREENRQ
ncbi:hypothetical protein [Sphingomonas sp.]|uniref:hypothetical protein n=1 Tax=Sphingomonas sp. TaxID=28214 RepID=UPI0025EDAA47|nr:hypothetical protein [Sphingomonas sp.]